MKCTRDRAIICISILFGLACAVAAALLVCVTVLKPLWTVWGRDEATKIIELNYDSLFKTEQEMLPNINDCTWSIETRNSTQGDQTVRVWYCDNGGTPVPTGKPQQGGSGVIISRRKRQAGPSFGVSDNDNCCATNLGWTNPLDMTAVVPGLGRVNVHVIHFNLTDGGPPRYQFVHEGGCGAPGLCTLGGGSCVLHSRVQPVLVSLEPIASRLDLLYAVYEDKVWFEEYEFPGSCKCVGASI